MPRRIINFDSDIDKHESSIKFKAKDFENLEISINLLENSKAYIIKKYNVDFVSTLDVLNITGLQSR